MIVRHHDSRSSAPTVGLIYDFDHAHYDGICTYLLDDPFMSCPRFEQGIGLTVDQAWGQFMKPIKEAMQLSLSGYMQILQSRLNVTHVTFGELPDPLGRRHWSLSFTHKLSRVSKSLTALFGMRLLTYGTNFLLLFAFLVSRPPQSALAHCQAPTLLLNRWLACLTGSSILVLKLTFSPDPFPRNLPVSLTD